jgi:transposase
MPERIVQEFIVRDKEIFVGLEDSKRTWRLCVRSEGMIIQQTSMPAIYDVLKRYFLNKFPNCKIHVIYEAGFRGFGLCDQLTEDGWYCTVTPPHTVTEEKCQKQKNDCIDARRLAKNLENNDYKKCFIPSKESREHRQTSRLYGQIKRDITTVKNRLRRTLEFHGLDNDFCPGNWSSKDYNNLRISLDSLNLSPSLQFSFKMMFKELDCLIQSKKEVLMELRKLAGNDLYKKHVELLESAPGIGALTATRLALEWGDVKRFPRKEEFANFVGLTPREHSSGEKEHKGHITKQGNSEIRSWLIESSWVAIRQDPALLGKFKNVLMHSGSKKKAIVAVARKLAIRLRAILITEQPYIIGLVA